MLRVVYDSLYADKRGNVLFYVLHWDDLQNDELYNYIIIHYVIC